MRAAFRFTPTAAKDLDVIWRYIAADSVKAADRVGQEITDTCARLADNPEAGTKRPHVTRLPVRFWPVTRVSKLRNRLQS